MIILPCRVCFAIKPRIEGVALCVDCAEAAGPELVDRLRRAAWWIAAPRPDEVLAAHEEYRKAWEAVRLRVSDASA